MAMFQLSNTSKYDINGQLVFQIEATGTYTSVNPDPLYPNDKQEIYIGLRGGYVESVDNLSNDPNDTSWIFPDSTVTGTSVIFNNSWIKQCLLTNCSIDNSYLLGLDVNGLNVKDGIVIE